MITKLVITSHCAGGGVNLLPDIQNILAANIRKSASLSYEQQIVLNNFVKIFFRTFIIVSDCRVGFYNFGYRYHFRDPFQQYLKSMKPKTKKRACVCRLYQPGKDTFITTDKKYPYSRPVRITESNFISAHEILLSTQTTNKPLLNL